ncbi:MAG TPA: cysteine--tRNA ligase [Chloroflexota bacterium]|nr:cysteine--tRNA ligase [Chloroflexota bacterium]
MTIRLYNSLTRRVEPFETIEPGVVRMYVCGVTVYDAAHIGHAMSAMVFDTLRRFLEWRGHRVIHVVNFTDVDDKIIARAQAEQRDPMQLAEEYIDEFLAQLIALNVLPATVFPRATQSIEDIVAFIGRLVDGGYAYAAGGDVYFRVNRAPQYGRLSGRTVESMLSGTRFEVDPRKEAPADFVLWKAAKPGEPSWPSPWGAGRPGWHIECSAMVLKHLGPQIDIHGGGADLIFPHHENEIAQSESLTQEPMARFWIHNGMLQYLNPVTRSVEKMSKSLGNVVTIKDFLQQHDADVLRLIVLGSAYRSPLTYNADVAADNARKLERLLGALQPALGTATSGAAADELRQVQDAVRTRFVEALEDDLNTARALAALFELVRVINMARAAGVGPAPMGEAQASLRELAGVLGLRLQGPAPATAGRSIAPLVELLIEVRAALRQTKQFELADTVRRRLAEQGILLEDGPQGTRWRETTRPGTAGAAGSRP